MIEFRPWSEADAAWYAEQAKDEQILRWTTDSPDLTAEDVRTAIAALPGDALAWMIVDAETGEPLGNAAVDVKDGIAEPSYWVAAPARGRGVATAALREMCARSVAAGAERVEVIIHRDNAASTRVAENVGFVAVRDFEHPKLGPCVRYRWDG
ncbi:GNAT family N-acetyltransferase [Allokutzneria albata]|uniref:Protein N-acetyltransferase, RimJ/RimL family n=1 Tax=Allokutzneria albata TaxID=211114 RepID=A0A1G9XB34_ALLAB|nr:GNAT family N-acetyltransferase [Allokutzneria albata]SDM93960.1 Protein N-acetyltransferase, RimJ/RimL family [Allokutzneria albata]